MNLFFILDTWWIHIIITVSFFISWFILNDKMQVFTRQNDGDGFEMGYTIIYTVSMIVLSNSLEKGDSLVFLPHGITISLQSIFLIGHLYDKTENKIDFYQYMLYSLFPLTLIGLFFI